jgi:hypothetical protein
MRLVLEANVRATQMAFLHMCARPSPSISAEIKVVVA